MAYEQDIEDGGAAGEQTPMLGSSSRQRSSGENKDNKWSFLHIFQFFGGGIYAPDPSTYDPIEILLNTEDEGQKNDLTVKWRDNKLSELNFVGIVVCTGCCYFSRLSYMWLAHTGHIPVMLHIGKTERHHTTDFA